MPLFPNPIITNPLNPKDVQDAAVKDTVKSEKLSKLIARNSGWSGQDAVIARAVVMAESSGNPKASNYCCHGLMQVNVLVHAGKYGIPKDRDKAIQWLYNPDNNIRAAYRIYIASGRSWQPWEGFTNGNYRQFMGQDPVIKYDDKNSLGEAFDDAGALGDVLKSPIDELTGLAATLFQADTWFRVIKVVGGAGLLSAGTLALLIVGVDKVGGSKVVKGAAKATAVGKVVK